jgi:flagellar hook assembly protein FlgD
VVDISGALIYYPFSPAHGDRPVSYPHYGLYKAERGAPCLGVHVDRTDVWHDDLFFRAYGAFVRHRIFEKLEPGITQYRLDQRHSSTPLGLRDAWYQGWDTFFSYAVRGAATLPHVQTADRRPLDPLALYRSYAEKVTLEADASGTYGWLDELQDKPGRGLNCELAWSLMMWRLFETYGSLFLTNLRSYALNAVSPKYMPVSVMAELFADQLSDFLALGLVPVIRLETPRSTLPVLTTAAPRISWHANGLLGGEDDRQLKFTLLYADNIEFVGAREIPIPHGTLLEFDFGKVLSEAEQAAKLNHRLGNGVWYFRVRCDSPAFPDVGARYGASSGIGAFRIAVPTQTVTAAGGAASFTASPGVAGQVVIPHGAVGGPLAVSAQPIAIASGVTGDAVVGGHAIDFGPEGTKFTPLAEMRFAFDEKLLGGISSRSVVVKRWDAESQAWVPLRTAIDPQTGEAVARSNSFSVYALMIDQTPPVITGLDDGPDPLGAGAADRSLITLRASENGLASVLILDGQGRVVRRLATDVEFSNNTFRTLWDLTDDRGQRVPDGTYVCRATMTDFGGHAAAPRECRIHVARQPDRELAGRVQLQNRTTAGDVLVTALDTTVTALTDASGAFRLAGLTPGTFDLRFSRPGYFPETRIGLPAVAPGGTATGAAASAALDVELRHLIVQEVRCEPAVVTPDADGLDDVLTCAWRLERPARLRAEVIDRQGRVVRRLLEGVPYPAGPATLVWDGKNDRQDVVGNGFYTLRVFAAIEDVELLQISQQVRLDAGLCQEVFALPAVFSPNGDGIEDTAVITFQVTEPGLVSLKIFDRGGQPVRTLLDRVEVRTALYNEPWDGNDDRGQPLPDGTYRYLLEAEYLDGTPSVARRGQLMVDRVAPQITKVSPPNGARLATGLPELSAVIVCSPGDVATAGIRLKIDEVTTEVDSYDPVTGRVTFTPRTSLGEGVHIAIFYAYDQAGNAAPPGAVSFEVKLPPGRNAAGQEIPFRDRRPPQITDLEPADGQTVYAANPLISCRLFDAEAGIDPTTISFWLNGQKVANQVTYYIPGRSGEDWDWWSYQRDVVLYNPLTGQVMFSPVQPLDEKTAWYSYSFEACDKQGNPVRSPTVKFKVVLDTRPPDIASLEPADQTVVTDRRPVVRARLTDTGGSGLAKENIRLFCNGERVDQAELTFEAATGLLTWTPAIDLDPDQQHLVSLVVFDRAGNRSAEAVTTFFCRPDTWPPVLASALPPPRAVISTRIERLVMRWIDPGGAGLDEASPRVTIDGRRVWPDDPATPALDGYRWHWEDPAGRRVARLEVPLAVTGPLAAGFRTVVVSVADRQGHRTADQVIDLRVSDDTVPPVITRLSPETDDSVPPMAIRVSAAFHDDDSGIDLSRLVLTLDGRPIAISPEQVAADGTGLHLTVMPPAPLERGSLHLLSLIVYDQAGNPSEPRVSLVRCQ